MSVRMTALRTHLLNNGVLVLRGRSFSVPMAEAKGYSGSRKHLGRPASDESAGDDITAADDAETPPSADDAPGADTSGSRRTRKRKAKK